MSDKSVAQMQREILCAGYYLRLTYGSGFYEAIRCKGEAIRAFYSETFEKLIESVYKESVK